MAAHHRKKPMGKQIWVSIIGIIACIGILIYMGYTGQFDTPQNQVVSEVEVNADIYDVVDMLLEGHPDFKDQVLDDDSISMEELDLMFKVYTAKVRIDHLDEVSTLFNLDSGGDNDKERKLNTNSTGN